MEDNSMKIKVYIIDVDGTLIPISPLFKLIKKYKLDDVIFYPNRNYHRFNNPTIKKFLYVLGDFISHAISFLAYNFIDKGEREYYRELFKRVAELSKKDNVLIIIVSRSYTAKFAFSDIINNGQKRKIMYYTIFGKQKKEFLKRISNYFQNKENVEVIIFEDNPNEVEEINDSNKIKKFLVDDPKETYHKLVLELYGK
ncbi:MAG: hypothetical protein QXP34_01920 [Candidatus Aenigmatarchaeota archaeon]